MNWLNAVLKTLARGMGVLSPNCRQAARLQSAALDRKLPILQRVGLRLHLLLCAWCRRYGKQIRFLRKAAHKHPDEMVEAAPQELSDEARERIKRKLRAEGE